MNAVLEALKNENLPMLKTLLLPANGKPFENLVKNKYMERMSSEGLADNYPGVFQYRETRSERRLDRGAVVWKNLSPEERQSLLRATSELYSPGDAEELEQLLTMRLP